jgi:hypothetical protein
LSEWSSLIVVLEDLLFSTGGLLIFANEAVQDAVGRKYINTTECGTKKKKLHAELAAFFTKLELNDRKVDELPHHYQQVRPKNPTPTHRLPLGGTFSFPCQTSLSLFTVQLPDLSRMFLHATFGFQSCNIFFLGRTI